MIWDKKTVFKISPNIIFRKQSEENYLLLEIEGDKLFELNDVSAFIWKQIIGNQSLENIHAAVEDTYEIEEGDITEVNAFISELLEQKIISP